MNADLGEIAHHDPSRPHEMAKSAPPSLPNRPFSGIFTLFLSLRPPFPAVVHPSRHIDNTLARPSCRRSCTLCPFSLLPTCLPSFPRALSSHLLPVSLRPKRSDRGRTKNGVLCRKILTFHTRHSKCEELFFCTKTAIRSHQNVHEAKISP